ncbi:MAG: class I adenylate-forming enzyme family protein [Lapillicoccus sp.]
MNPLVMTPAGRGGLPVIRPELVSTYQAAGWWGSDSLAQIVADRARRPGPDADRVALVSGALRWTWWDYDQAGDRYAQALLALGRPRGTRVAVLLPDGNAVHAALVGCVRSGHLAVGIGHRAGDAEIAYLLDKTAATVLVVTAVHRGRPVAVLVEDLVARGARIETVIVVGADDLPDLVASGLTGATATADPDRAFGPSEVSMLNSTSGTTGRPKCVTQFDNRWLRFADLAADAGRLTADDVVLAVVPAPFGFGLWTQHFLGPRLGAPTVVMPRFSADEMIRLIESERVTLLCCVTTQFRMMLNSPLADTTDLSSLRVMFTGGEAVPVDRAAEFERRTGATLLQFYGSNEAGGISLTTLDDPQDKRLTTSGRLLPEMEPRLFDPDGGAATPELVGSGAVPGGRGPTTCAGYFDDEGANEQLFTSDGWMLLGDLVRVDADGYLVVVGRTSDIIIRGGKNISAGEVENHIESHPLVALVAVVPEADPVFGERVCAVVSLLPGADLDLERLTAYLDTRGVSREWWPERLVVVDEIPRSSGGKIAKGQVRELVQGAASH